MICVRCRVSGRVQGVWFRAATRDRARSLGLTGRAVNLPDGRVEVVACGEPAAVAALQAWLWQGSELAQVRDVVCESLPFQEYSGEYSGADSGFSTG